MRHADVSRAPAAARASGAAPGGANRRAIRTTRIPAPRLARQDGSTVLELPANVQPLVQPAAPTSTSRVRGWMRDEHLRLVLGIGDAIAVLVGFYLVILWVSPVRLSSWLELVVQMVAVTSVGLLAIRSQGLWVDRMISVRAIELSRLARAIVLLGLGTIVLDRAIRLYFHVEEIFIGCAVGFVALVAWRSIYRTWLASQRKVGNFQRRVIIVGSDRRAVQLTSLFRTHPEVGIRVVGLVGSARQAREAGLADLWMANSADAPEVLDQADVEGVVLCSSDISPAMLELLVMSERSRSRDLYVDPGLSGIDFRRVQTLPVSHQPLLYVEPPRLSRLQIELKRGFDAFVAATMLIVLSPVMLFIALVIKLEDRGPVFFKQQRVGRGGTEFGMIKFRSMCVDAEARLAALRATNERNGPLFKMDGGDPRVTRIGRFLRATSLDELPQLINVLCGDMSLVGPRPALASEVAEFPAELNARHQVRPGITGLWQVEARDNPSFEAYQRLDLFYVENWSLALDMIILLGTIDQVLLRPLVNRHRPAPEPAPEALVV